MDNAIIQEFGLPTWFADEDVPMAVAEFCSETANKPLEYVLDLAQQRGFNPLCRPMPHVEPNLIGFGIAVNGQFVPLMIKLGNKPNSA